MKDPTSPWLFARRSLAALSTTLVLFGCAPTSGPATDEADSFDISELRWGSASDSNRWIYNGPLPALVEPSIVVSIAGHTARVSGYLPQGFSGPVPFYATVTDDRGRRRVTVVYPVATGATTNAPGSYTDIRGLPYLPYAANSNGDFVPWGGFPFLEYNRRRNIAFHGPITHGMTATGVEWLLKRGPVSRGCNRMQGEHVVELAHLIGMQMNNTHAAFAERSVRVNTTVIEGYDVLNGQSVDVNYPRTAGAVAPSGPVRMFRTWWSSDFPRWVCAFKSGRALDNNHCAYEPPNRLDPATGEEPANAPTVMIDNATQGVLSTTGGPWEITSARPGYVGVNYAALAAGRAGEAAFTVPSRVSGRYRVLARYIAHSNRNTAVRYVISRRAGDAAPVTVTFNQRTGDGWADLGVHELGAGARVAIPVPSTSDGYTIVDALRFDRAP